MDTGSLIYYGALTLWSALVAYGLLSLFAPKKNVEAAAPVEVAPLPPRPEVAPAPAPAPVPQGTKPTPETLMREGFKAFQQGPDLAVEDIVKGLSRG